LVVNYWNGFVWQWADQGLPAGASSVSPLDAVTYSDGGQRIYVFAKAMGPAFPSYPGPKLVVNYWDGSAWHWLNMGGAGGGDVTRASAITYFDGCEGRGCEGRQRVYLFSTSSDYKSLWTTYWDGYGWHSADLGAPPGHTGISGPVSAVTFLDNAGQRRIYVFVSNHVLGASTDLVAKLYLKYWNGSAWNWADRGAPSIPSGVHSNYRLDATSYADSNGYRWVHVFGSLVLAAENPGQYEDHWVRNFSVLGAFASWAYQGTLP
jgi:hypothetical protein